MPSLVVLVCGLCLTALSLFVSLPATLGEYPNPDTFTINGIQFSEEDVVRFAPILFYHPAEQFYPVNLDVMNSASWLSGGDIPKNSPINLGEDIDILGDPHYCCNGTDGVYYTQTAREFMFGLNDTIGPNPNGPADMLTSTNCYNVTRSRNTIERRGGTITTEKNWLRMLWSFSQFDPNTLSPDQRDAGLGSAILLTFYVWNAWSGHQNLIYDGYPMMYRELADHEGDMQSVFVVVDQYMEEVLMVGSEAHGYKYWLATSFLNQTRPLLYVSLNTHGIYSSPVPNKGGFSSKSQDWYSFQPWPLDFYWDWTSSLQPPYTTYFQLDNTTKCFVADVQSGNGTCANIQCPSFEFTQPSDLQCTYQGVPIDAVESPINVVDIWGMGSVWSPTVGNLYHVGKKSDGSPWHYYDLWTLFNGRIGPDLKWINQCRSIDCWFNDNYFCGDNDAVRDVLWVITHWGLPSFCDWLGIFGKRDAGGPEGLGGRHTMNPIVDYNRFHMPPLGSQRFIRLPDEGVTLDGFTSSLRITYRRSDGLLFRNRYRPMALIDSTHAWERVRPGIPVNRTGDVTVDSDIDIVTFSDEGDFITVFVSKGKLYYSVNDGEPNWSGFVAPVLINNYNPIANGRPRITFDGYYLWIVWYSSAIAALLYARGDATNWYSKQEIDFGDVYQRVNFTATSFARPNEGAFDVAVSPRSWINTGSELVIAYRRQSDGRLVLGSQAFGGEDNWYDYSWQAIGWDYSICGPNSVVVCNNIPGAPTIDYDVWQASFGIAWMTNGFLNIPTIAFGRYYPGDTDPAIYINARLGPAFPTMTFGNRQEYSLTAFYSGNHELDFEDSHFYIAGQDNRGYWFTYIGYTIFDSIWFDLSSPVIRTFYGEFVTNGTSPVLHKDSLMPVNQPPVLWPNLRQFNTLSLTLAQSINQSTVLNSHTRARSLCPVAVFVSVSSGSSL